MNVSERILELVGNPPVAPRHLTEEQLASLKALPMSIKLGVHLGRVGESVSYACGSIPLLKQAKRCIQNTSYGIKLGMYERKLDLYSKELEKEEEAPEPVVTPVTRVPTAQTA